MTVELEGCVNSIRFRNDDNGYTVFELATKDSADVLTCVGSFSYISEGEYYKLVCGETTHSVYGKQYKVISYESIEPEDAAAMERYLGSGAIKGVGKALAARIVKEFGDETFRVIEEEPERLADIKGISEKMARSISENFYDKREMRNAMMFLQKYGISSSLSVKIYKKYGSELYQVIRTNPYRLAEEIKGVGFKTADDIASRGNFRINPEFRARAAMLYILSESIGDGHTFLPKKMFFEEAARMLEQPLESLKAPLEGLELEKKVIVSRLNLSEMTDGIEDYGTDEDGKTECVYLAPFFYMELAVARMLLDLDVRIGVKSKEIDGFLESTKEELGLELDEIQRNAVRTAATNGVMVLTGGPGTGKTTTIQAIIHFFESQGLDILLAAPTGRAAKRMNETTGREALTIHRMLQMKGDIESDDLNGQKLGFERNEMNPLETDVIIIDEMSMVDISLMNALLRATAQGTRLILVGDADQLPSVGPGVVLKDIIASGKFATVCLTNIFRQAALSDIVVNAHKINRGEIIPLDNKSKDFFFKEKLDAEAACQTVAELVRDKLPGYVKASAFEIQVLTPTRKGILGVENLNKVLQEYMNPADKSKKEKMYGDTTFREGDKVMQVKNNYQLGWESRNSRGFVKASGSGIFNGDCGIIRRINTFSEELEIVFDDDKLVYYPYSLLEDLELAYSVTVHKSQGSEYPAVVLPLISGPKQLLYRNLLYTAVTRAKDCVVIVGKKQCVYDMIDNEQQHKRFSGLKEHLMTI